MNKAEDQVDKRSDEFDAIGNQWGEQPEDNFGYATDEERRAKRGLEDWELLEGMSGSQPGLFAWLRTVVGSVVAGVVVFIMVAYGIYYISYHYGPTLLGKG
jgi:hypothetical protein